MIMFARESSLPQTFFFSSLILCKSLYLLVRHQKRIFCCPSPPCWPRDWTVNLAIQGGFTAEGRMSVLVWSRIMSKIKLKLGEWSAWIVSGSRVRGDVGLDLSLLWRIGLFADISMISLTIWGITMNIFIETIYYSKKI